jgi:hypothetical protein
VGRQHLAARNYRLQNASRDKAVRLQVEIIPNFPKKHPRSHYFISFSYPAALSGALADLIVTPTVRGCGNIPRLRKKISAIPPHG